MFFIMVVMVYIPTSTVGEFLSLPNLSNTCYDLSKPTTGWLCSVFVSLTLVFKLAGLYIQNYFLTTSQVSVCPANIQDQLIDTSYFNSVRWYVTVVLICIFPIISEVQHLLIPFLGIYPDCLEKVY